MKCHLWLTSTVFVLASLLVNAQEAKKGKETPKPGNAPNYFPLAVGNKWIYRIDTGAYTVTNVATIAKIETIDGMPLARFESKINDDILTEHLLQTDQGIFRHRLKDQAVTPPVKLLQYPAKAGDKWQGEIAVGKEKGTYSCTTAEDSVQVPAGKFKTMRVDIKFETEDKGGKSETKVSYWFAENVGFVKQTIAAGNLKLTVELEKFTPAKENKGKKGTKEKK